MGTSLAEAKLTSASCPVFGDALNGGEIDCCLDSLAFFELEPHRSLPPEMSSGQVFRSLLKLTLTLKLTLRLFLTLLDILLIVLTLTLTLPYIDWGVC